MADLESKVWFAEHKDENIDAFEFYRKRYNSRPWRPWHHINLLNYYIEHFLDVPRGKLQKLDPAFYQKMREAGLLIHVPNVYNVTKYSYTPISSLSGA